MRFTVFGNSALARWEQQYILSQGQIQITNREAWHMDHGTILADAQTHTPNHYRLKAQNVRHAPICSKDIEMLAQTRSKKDNKICRRSTRWRLTIQNYSVTNFAWSHQPGPDMRYTQHDGNSKWHCSATTVEIQCCASRWKHTAIH